MKKHRIITFLLLIITFITPYSINAKESVGKAYSPFVFEKFGILQPKRVQNMVDTNFDEDTIILEVEDINKLDQMKIEDEIIRVYDKTNNIKIKIKKGQSIDKVIKKYRAKSYIKNIKRDYYRKASFIPNDPFYNREDYPQWNLKLINMENAWDLSMGDDIIVAVIDTGVNATLPDLEGKCLLGYNAITGQEDTDSFRYSTDDNFHGTAVSHVIAANTNNSIEIAGVAPNVKIMPIKALDYEGNGLDSDIADGIYWAVDHGADIINLSLGGPDYNSHFEEAVQYAYDNNVLLIAATGNDSANSVDYPAAFQQVIAVGSTNTFDNRSTFSNYGSEVDIVAPGQDILLPYLDNYINGEDNYYYLMNGTSFSCPTITGVAALAKSTNSILNNEQIRQILLTSVVDLEDYGWDEQNGFGRIDAFNTLELTNNSTIWDHNDNFEEAEVVTTEDSISGTMFPARDVDYYKFYISDDTSLKITLSGSESFDGVIILLDENRNIIDSIDSTANGLSEILEYSFNNPGYYYVVVVDYYGNYSNDPYSLELRKNIIIPSGTTRLSGTNRFDTGTQISQLGWDTTQNVILVNGRNFPDALAGSPLAYVLNAPILLVEKDKIPEGTLEELSRLDPTNIYLLGGIGAIEDSIKVQLEELEYSVTRVSGNNRINTAVEIGRNLRNIEKSNTIVISNGYNYPDALGIGSIAAVNHWPILFTKTTYLNESTRQALVDWSIENVIIIGGKNAVSDDTLKEIQALDINVERVAGNNRIYTALEVAKRFNSFPQGIIVATGYNFPDALAGGPLAGVLDYPILLVKPNEIKQEVLDFINQSGCSKVIILGGLNAINIDVQNEINYYLDD